MPSWSYGSWICNYLCNQCLSPLSCEFESCSWLGVVDTTLCDKGCQWFSQNTRVFSTNKTGCFGIGGIVDHHCLNCLFIQEYPVQTTCIYNRPMVEPCSSAKCCFGQEVDARHVSGKQFNCGSKQNSDNIITHVLCTVAFAN
jgi:hypothetical protein